MNLFQLLALISISISMVKSFLKYTPHLKDLSPKNTSDTKFQKAYIKHFVWTLACISDLPNEIFNKYSTALSSIAKIKSVQDFKGPRSEGDIQIIHENETFFLKLFNIIDFKEESIRLKKNLSKVSSEIEKIRIKLESAL